LLYFTHWVYSFNGKTSVSKTEVAGSSPAGPAFASLKLGYGAAKPATKKSESGIH
jgi:hypothetical protein